MTKTILLAAVLLMVGLPVSRAATEDGLAPKLRGALVKVYTTAQGYDMYSPWKKGRPRNNVQRGVMVRPGLVLTLSNGMVNQLMIEVSESNSSRRYPASLAHVDHAAGLALVKVEDESLRARMKPLGLGEPITIDAEVDIWQIGAGELLVRRTGKVQRVYPSNSRLNLTINTNLADRGDGQVALQDGELVGLVDQISSSRQEGRLISQETIQHFLKDYDSGKYRGFPTGGISWHPLLRDDLRSLYEVPEDQHGLAISHVVPGRSGDGVVREGDVIVEVMGHDLDDEGMFDHPFHGRLDVRYLMYGLKHPGETLPATILRKGEPVEVEIPLRNWPREEQLIPVNYNDHRPPFMVVGGLIILEMTQRSSVRSGKLRRMQARAWWDPPGERKRIIYASRVLVDPATKGLETIGGVAILDVNGRKITQLRDVAEALKTPVGGYHVFTFDENEKNFVIKADQLEETNERISKRYRIPELSYFGE